MTDVLQTCEDQAGDQEATHSHEATSRQDAELVAPSSTHAGTRSACAPTLAAGRPVHDVFGVERFRTGDDLPKDVDPVGVGERWLAHLDAHQPVKVAPCDILHHQVGLRAHRSGKSQHTATHSGARIAAN